MALAAGASRLFVFEATRAPSCVAILRHGWRQTRASGSLGGNEVDRLLKEPSACVPAEFVNQPGSPEAAARSPLITISSTVASRNEFRKARVGGVQLLILIPPGRMQTFCSQRGCV